jgi:hypothetical protein
MGYLFAVEEIVDHSISAIDSTLLKSNGHVWHKSSMKKGIVPRPGIDTDARWGYSRTKGWIFGYKLHLTCTTGDCGIFNSRCNIANVPDNKMYVSLTSSPSPSPSPLVFSLPFACYIVADPGYDDKNLYEYSKKTLRIDLICPLERYEIF